jgi:hypothetical protein
VLGRSFEAPRSQSQMDFRLHVCVDGGGLTTAVAPCSRGLR